MAEDLFEIWIHFPKWGDEHKEKDPTHIFDLLRLRFPAVKVVSDARPRYIDQPNWISTGDACAPQTKSPCVILSYHFNERTLRIFRRHSNRSLLILKPDSGGYIPSYRSTPYGSQPRGWIHWAISPLKNHCQLRVIKECVSIADTIFWESHTARSVFNAALPEFEKKMEVARNPVKACQTQVGTKEPIILAVGRWHDLKQKRIDRLLDAYTRYRKQEEDPFKLIVAGTTPPATPAPPGVTLTGRLNGGQLSDLYTRASILLSSSEWEGFPNIFNEALVAGCSIVSTPLPAALDCIQAVHAGEIARAYSSSALACALAHEARRWQLGQRDPTQIATSWRLVLEAESYPVMIKNAYRRFNSRCLSSSSASKGAR